MHVFKKKIRMIIIETYLIQVLVYVTVNSIYYVLINKHVRDLEIKFLIMIIFISYFSVSTCIKYGGILI